MTAFELLFGRKPRTSLDSLVPLLDGVERFGRWLQEILAELCKAWPGRWDEYVALACWIKRTLPDSSLQSKMTAFELLFGRKPRTPLDSLVPLLDGAAQGTSLDNFVEQRSKTFWKSARSWNKEKLYEQPLANALTPP